MTWPNDTPIIWEKGGDNSLHHGWKYEFSDSAEVGDKYDRG